VPAAKRTKKLSAFSTEKAIINIFKKKKGKKNKFRKKLIIVSNKEEPNPERNGQERVDAKKKGRIHQAMSGSTKKSS